MAIKIPVSAQFDAAELKQQIQMVNDQIRILASQVGQANKQKFEPINLKSKEDLVAFTKQMERLLKVQTELKQNMSKTGQGATNPLMADWKKLYGDQATRITKMQNMLQFLGVEFDNLPAPKVKPPAVPAQSPTTAHQPAPAAPVVNQWGRARANVFQGAMGGFGRIGNVTSGAISTGMSSGASAGLAGLIGGLGALAAGAVINKVVDSIGDSQQQAMAMDKVLRASGINSSFGGGRAAFYSAANSTGMDINAFTSYASRYQSQSGFKGSALALASEAQSVRQFARGFGLEPSEAAAPFASARRLNTMSSNSDMQKLGLMIGEGIVKSGAFSQSQQFLEAANQFITMQARQSLAMPNVGAFAGSLTSLVSSNTPGLDVENSAALLNQANSALSHGGSFGEASQAATARAFMRAGVNSPFQARILSQSGMFATPNSVMGAGSQYAQRFGARNFGATGDLSVFDLTRNQLRRQLGRGTEQYYLGLANHLGVNLPQAMALGDMNTTDINSTQRQLKTAGVDINSVNLSSIGDLMRIQKGGGRAVAGELLGRSGSNALAASDRERLNNALASGNKDQLDKVTASIVASTGQTKTEGERTRDSLAAVKNSIQQYSDKALPLLNTSMQALVTLTGKAPGQMRRDYLAAEHAENLSNIKAQGNNDVQAAEEKLRQWQMQNATKAKDKTYFQQENELKQQITAARTTAARSEEVENSRYDAASAVPVSAGTRENIAKMKISGAAFLRMQDMDKDFESAAKEYGVNANDLRSISATESMFTNARSGKNAGGEMQVMPGNQKGFDMSKRSDRIRAGARMWADAMRQANGDKTLAARIYNGGRPLYGNRENDEFPLKVEQYRNQIEGRQAQLGQIDPKTMPKSTGEIRVKADPIEVQHKDSSGQVMKTQQVAMKTDWSQQRSWANR